MSSGYIIIRKIIMKNGKVIVPTPGKLWMEANLTRMTEIANEHILTLQVSNPEMQRPELEEAGKQHILKLVGEAAEHWLTDHYGKKVKKVQFQLSTIRPHETDPNAVTIDKVPRFEITPKS